MVDFGRLVVKCCWNVALIGVCLALSIYLGSIIHCFFFLVHELGHVFFGTIGNVLHGTWGRFEIANFLPAPNINFIQCPQQIRMIGGYESILFTYGGIILGLLTVSLIAVYLYQKTRIRWYWGFIAVYTFHELFNSLCGTDHIGDGFPVFCANSIVGQWSNVFTYSQWFLITIIMFLHFKKLITKWKLDNIIEL